MSVITIRSFSAWSWNCRNRTKWRSKQNLDYSFLMMYGQARGKYYCQLEDDIVAAPGYFLNMRWIPRSGWPYIKEGINKACHILPLYALRATTPELTGVSGVVARMAGGLRPYYYPFGYAMPYAHEPMSTLNLLSAWSWTTLWGNSLANTSITNGWCCNSQLWDSLGNYSYLLTSRLWLNWCSCVIRVNSTSGGRSQNLLKTTVVIGGFHNQADGRLLGDFGDHSWHKTIFFRLNIAPTCLEQLMRCWGSEKSQKILNMVTENEKKPSKTQRKPLLESCHRVVTLRVSRL
jgi:hypothetical protein